MRYIAIFVVLLATLLPAAAGLVNISNSIRTASSGGSGNTLTWTAPTTNLDATSLSDLTSYRIWWGETSGIYENHTTISSSSTSLDLTTLGLTSGHTYHFRVSGIDSDGNEGWLTTTEQDWTAP